MRAKQGRSCAGVCTRTACYLSEPALNLLLGSFAPDTEQAKALQVGRVEGSSVPGRCAHSPSPSPSPVSGEFALETVNGDAREDTAAVRPSQVGLLTRRLNPFLGNLVECNGRRHGGVQRFNA